MTIREIERLLLASGRKAQKKGKELSRYDGSHCILGVSHRMGLSNSAWAMRRFNIRKYDAQQIMNGWDNATICSAAGAWPDPSSPFYKLGERLAAKLLK